METSYFDGARHTTVLYGGPGATIGNIQTKSLLCIVVHDNMVSVIIGKRGSTIKKIVKQTNVWIHVHNINVGCMGKAITIKGDPQNCTNACRKIMEVMLTKATNLSDAMLKILIQNNLIGIIIGEEGNMIRKVMAETETKINVSSIPDTTIDSISYKIICTVEGSTANMSKAEAQISSKLRH